MLSGTIRLGLRDVAKRCRMHFPLQIRFRGGCVVEEKGEASVQLCLQLPYAWRSWLAEALVKRRMVLLAARKTVQCVNRQSGWYVRRREKPPGWITWLIPIGAPCWSQSATYTSGSLAARPRWRMIS